jgi:hypothetical protein
MPPSTVPHSLLPTQSRLINASEGFHLIVQSGCLWLTRPGDGVDRFLVAGSSIELHENHVLVQSDSPRSMSDPQTALYWLTPLNTPRTAVQRVSARSPVRPRLLQHLFGSIGIGFIPKLKAHYVHPRPLC